MKCSKCSFESADEVTVQAHELAIHGDMAEVERLFNALELSVTLTMGEWRVLMSSLRSHPDKVIQKIVFKILKQAGSAFQGGKR